MTVRALKRTRTFTHFALGDDGRTACSEGWSAKATSDLGAVTCPACRWAARNEATIAAIAELVSFGLTYVPEDDVFKRATAVEKVLVRTLAEARDFELGKGLDANAIARRLRRTLR